MEHWNLRELAVEPHKPQVLHSEGEGRAIVLHLPRGEALQEHQVHERAWIVVVDGEIEVEQGGETVSGGSGFMAVFGPRERHEVRARADARLLMVLAPWPGEGRGDGR